MHTPDGMGEDMHRERQNMKEARQETRTPPWELAAYDEYGEELYRTEYFESQEEAVQEAIDLTEDMPDNIDDEVVEFKAVPSK